MLVIQNQEPGDAESRPGKNNPPSPLGLPEPGDSKRSVTFKGNNNIKINMDKFSASFDTISQRIKKELAKTVFSLKLFLVHGAI